MSDHNRQKKKKKDDALRKLIEQALKDDLIEPSQTARFSQVLLTIKKNNTYRLCVDYRDLNAASQSLGLPTPNIKGLLNRLSEKKPKYFAVMDIYLRVLLDTTCRRKPINHRVHYRYYDHRVDK